MNRASAPRSPVLHGSVQPKSGWQKVWLLGIVALPLILGGGAERVSQGLFLSLLGGLLATFPPKSRPHPAFIALLLTLLALAATAFLPAAWFAAPVWREQLSAAGLALPATLSPQPLLSLEAAVLLTAGALWFVFLSGQAWSKADRLQLLRVTAAGTILFAGTCLWFFWQKSTPAFWFGPRGFGPFPNRNHTGDVLAVGGILIVAFAHRSWRHQRKTWPLWWAGFSVVLFAAIENYSRAGVAFLLTGTVCWIALVGWVSRARKWLLTGVAAAGVFIALFALFGGDTLRRFQTEAIVEDGQWLGFRGKIYRDVWAMMQTGPVCGIGLGNFRPVFPFYREASRLEVTTLHPESDWLWAGAELGWAGLFVLVAASGFWLARCLPFTADGESRIRAAACLAFVAFLLHGVVDVAGHRLGSATLALFIGSLALRRDAGLVIGSAGSLLFRLAGVALLIVGLVWVSGAWPAAEADQLPLRLSRKLPRKETAREAEPAAIVQSATAQIRRAPLNGQLYFTRAAARASQGDLLGALGDFRIARALQPIFSYRALAEGRVWCVVQPMLALPVWRDALERCPVDRRAAIYAQILTDGAAIPELRPHLRALAGAEPAMLLAYLRLANAEESREIVATLRTADPRLEAFDDAARRAIFTAWIQHDDAAAWEREMAQNPAWLPAGWSLLARRVAAQEDFRRACTIAFAHLAPPVLPPSLSPSPSTAELQRRLLINPTNYAAAFALYQTQLLQTAREDALATLQQVTAQPSAPPYFRHLQARLQADLENWSAAWKALEPILPP